MAETIKLPARMDLSAAQAFVSDLSEKNFSNELTLDASDVNHIGALCLQAIIAGARAASEAGGSFVIKDTSEKVQEQLELMGLTVAEIEGGVQ